MSLTRIEDFKSYLSDAGLLHVHGFLPHPMHRPVALRFLALRMDGVSETNFVQCLYFLLLLSLLASSGI